MMLPMLCDGAAAFQRSRFLARQSLSLAQPSAASMTIDPPRRSMWLTVNDSPPLTSAPDRVRSRG